MKITKLVLHNIGVFAGSNTLNLISNKPIILIGGLNGRGKTTILEAILLALYGSRASGFFEGRPQFTKYLMKLGNITDGTYQSFIELTLSIDTDVEETYMVRREWKTDSTNVKLNTIVYKDGILNNVLSNNWDMFIEEVLPHAIAPFFIFDGEKISELAASENDMQMKESIKSLLGLDIIEQSLKDIKQIRDSKGKAAAENIYFKDYDKNDKEIRAEQRNLKKLKDEFKEIQFNLANLQEKKEKLENDFVKLGGVSSEYKIKLETQREDLKEHLKQVDREVVEYAAGGLPIFLVEPLLREIEEVTKEEERQENNDILLKQLPELYCEYSKSEEIPEEIQNFLSYIKTKTNSKGTAFHISLQGRSQLTNLLHSIPSIKLKVKEKLKQKKDIQKCLKELDNQLISAEANRDITDQISRQKKRIIDEIVRSDYQKTLLEDRIKEKEYIINQLQKEQDKINEKLILQLENQDDTKRILIYAAYAQKILEKYRTVVQMEKVNMLADTMTSCFKEITTKGGLIEKIEIDAETLEFSYSNGLGYSVDKMSLSAGEKQLLVIAMLWALGICSEKRLPVIIDTPLGRLDSLHRECLIKNYFPKASEQVIILSTDQEVTNKDYLLLKPFIGREFVLSYNDKSMSTSIQDGYFRSEDV